MLFSLVPFVALFVAIGELVLSEQTQGRVAEWLTEALPLPEGVQEGVENVIADAGTAASIAGIVGAPRAALGGDRDDDVDSSGVQGNLGRPRGRPVPARQAVSIVALVLAAGVIAVSAFGLTVIAQFVASASTESSPSSVDATTRARSPAASHSWAARSR